MSGPGKKVTVLPATKELLDVPKKSGMLRVAAYCRVSTRKSEQESSYEAQVDHYTQRMKQNPDWICVGIFADQGMSGVSADKRKGFQKMIRACRAGKIDMVIAKSVSRFCRNTLDGLEYIRELTSLGVDIYFEKENIHTLYLNNEMLLTFIISQAQSESESLSGNVKWGHRKNFAASGGMTAWSRICSRMKNTSATRCSRKHTLSICLPISPEGTRGNYPNTMSMSVIRPL